MSARIDPPPAGYLAPVPLALNSRLDHSWIKPSARIDATTPDHATRASRERRFWIKRDAPGAMLAENPTLPCAFTLTRPETDQYMDPWRDVALSLSPNTRDRHAYAAGNPVGRTDTNGHCSSGQTSPGTEEACADNWNNFCRDNPKSPMCAGRSPSNPVRPEQITAVPAPGAVPGDPTFNNGSGYTPPTVIAPAKELKAPLLARVGGVLSYPIGMALPGVSGSEAQQAAEDGGWACANAIGFSGRGAILHNSGCTDAYGWMVPTGPPVAGGAGFGAKTIARSVTSGMARRANPLRNTTYTPKVLGQMGEDTKHGFPSMIDGMATPGHVSRELGEDGSAYIHVRIPGARNGSTGNYHYIISPDGTINHRMFDTW